MLAWIVNIRKNTLQSVLKSMMPQDNVSFQVSIRNITISSYYFSILNVDVKVEHNIYSSQNLANILTRVNILAGLKTIQMATFIALHPRIYCDIPTDKHITDNY